MGTRSKRGFVTLDVLWIILLLIACAYLSVRGIELVDRRDKADRLKRELVAIGAAVEARRQRRGWNPGPACRSKGIPGFSRSVRRSASGSRGKTPSAGAMGTRWLARRRCPRPVSIEAMGELWK